MAASLPIWRTGAFAGEFCDAYLENTELEGGKLGPSCLSLAALLRADHSKPDLGASLLAFHMLLFFLDMLCFQEYYQLEWKLDFWS